MRRVRKASTRLSSRGIEIEKFRVALQDVRELNGHIAALAREQHPQVLDRRTHAAIVEVDEMRTAVGPQNIAGVAVAVQADNAHLTRARIAVSNLFQYVFRQTAIGELQLGGDETLFEYVTIGFLAELFDAEGGAMVKRFYRPHGMDTADEAAQPQQIVRVVQVGPAPAAASETG